MRDRKTQDEHFTEELLQEEFAHLSDLSEHPQPRLTVQLYSRELGQMRKELHIILYLAAQQKIGKGQCSTNFEQCQADFSSDGLRAAEPTRSQTKNDNVDGLEIRLNI